MASRILSFLALAGLGLAAKHQQYPQYPLSIDTYQMHETGDQLPLYCIKRHIDSGEHVFDEETNEIVYVPFPSCYETNRPFNIEFGVDSKTDCTVQMDDELFHLFQLYLHKDAPWTCRLETRKGSGVYIPIDFSVRGNVLESHVDLDPNMNLIVMSYSEDDSDTKGEIIAGVAFSASQNTTKVIIGDKVKFTFNINWANKSKGLTILQTDKETATDDQGDEIERFTNAFLLNELRNKSLFDSSFYVLVFFLITLGLGSLLGVLVSYRRLGRKIQATNNSWINKVE